jgi:hypothetical protein
MSTFFPQGSNIYSPDTGTRLIRFVISDATQMIDLSTLRLAFELNNTNGGRPMRVTGHPGMCWFQRIRVYIGGTLCEDIMYNHRVSSMYQKLKPPDKVWSESMSLLGQTTDSATSVNWQSYYAGGPSNAQVAAANSMTIVTPIFCGLCQTHYMLPGQFPLTLELELVNNAELCLPHGAAASSPLAPATPGLFSQNFNITQPRILVDCVQVDVTIQNEIRTHLAAGKPLQLALSTWSTTMHSVLTAGAVGNQSWDVTLSRAFSRVKDIYITFDSDASRGVVNTESNNFISWHGKPDKNVYGGSNPYDDDYGEGFRFQLQTGALVFPDLPITSHTEAFYQLSKSLAMQSHNEGVNIPPGEYLGQNFILALDLEKMYSSPGAGFVRFSGLNTQGAGDTLRMTFQNVHARNADWLPTRQFVTLHHDVVVELRAEGVICLD